MGCAPVPAAGEGAGGDGVMGGDGPVGVQAASGFGGLLRRLRAGAGLTQEGLAEAARLSPRSVSDLERGINRTARKETARLLADALGLIGPARAEFEAAAQGRPVPGGAGTGGVAAATRTLPRDVVSFTGRQAELGSWRRLRRVRAGWWGFTRSAGWPGGQDHVRGARRAPAGRPVPGRADLPAA